MLRLIPFKHKLTKKEYITKQLERELKRFSKGRMPKSIRKTLAQRTVERLDFSNYFHMHKSIQGYADLLVSQYMGKDK